jgi:hypothetical protein
MADLLECLIQIKALGESLDMVTRSMSAGSSPETEGVTRSGVWRRMAEAERHYAIALGAEAEVQPKIAAEDSGTASAKTEFVAQRRANLSVLSRCTAAQLAGIVEWPGRRSTTVADLVAVMLANDTEVLGELRHAPPGPEPR